MSLDYRTTIENALWTLFEGDSAFVAAFRAGNRIKMNTASGWLRERSKAAPADYPQIKIELKDGAQPVDGQVKVFGMNSTSYTSATVDVPIKFSLQVNAVFTYDKLTTGDQSPLETIAERLLWSKWPKLGLAYIMSYTTKMTRAEKKIKSVIRQESTLAITFNCRAMLSQLASA